MCTYCDGIEIFITITHPLARRFYEQSKERLECLREKKKYIQQSDKVLDC